MPGEAGSEFHALLVKEEWAAHPAQGARRVEPDEPLMVKAPLLGLAPLHLVDQKQPAAREWNGLRAAPEIMSRNSRRLLDERSPMLVQHPRWIAEIDEL